MAFFKEKEQKNQQICRESHKTPNNQSNPEEKNEQRQCIKKKKKYSLISNYTKKL